ncbi:MAG: hypothetical protein HC819_05575 [Cyclobacteriaceae bacterium]|nr:hypothetical protein [Cyclobacteriaceae bacterium]
MHLFIWLLPLLPQANRSEYQLQQRVAIEAPSDVSLDKAGNVYIGTYDGDVIKYDAELKHPFDFFAG